jgi:hypothetical protein
MTEAEQAAFYQMTTRAALGQKAGVITLQPAPTNVTDMRTGKAWYPPGSLARALSERPRAEATEA